METKISQYIGVFLVGIIIGTGVTFVYFKKASASGVNEYQAGFDAAKKLVLESQMGGIFHSPEDVRALAGTVTAVNGNSISIHAQSMNPFEDESLNNRTIIVASDTKITKITQKDSKIMQAEMDVFMKNMKASKNSTSSLTPPEPFIRTSSTVTDIKVGDSINVTSLENIKNSKEFSVSEIQIQSKMVTE